MYRVYGQETGELGTYATLKEAKKAIKEVTDYDMKTVGETDTFTIEEE